jgi:hypothetical protein
MNAHPIQPYGLGFDLSGLTLADLHTVYDHMTALSQITDGLMCQPRCMVGRNANNGAGQLMTDLGDRIAHELEAIAAEAASRQPVDRTERDYRDNIIVRASLSATDDVAVDLAMAFQKIGRLGLVDDLAARQG